MLGDLGVIKEQGDVIYVVAIGKTIKRRCNLYIKVNEVVFFFIYRDHFPTFCNVKQLINSEASH